MKYEGDDDDDGALFAIEIRIARDWIDRRWNVKNENYFYEWEGGKNFFLIIKKAEEEKKTANARPFNWKLLIRFSSLFLLVFWSVDEYVYGSERGKQSSSLNDEKRKRIQHEI